MTQSLPPNANTQDMPSTALFSSPLSISQDAGLVTDLVEDTYQCLRLAQLIANDRFVREIQAKEWFASFLETLKELGFKLIEHTRKAIPYNPSDDVLKDVFEGWLPPPQTAKSSFHAAAKNALNEMQASEDNLYRKYTSSTHLSITLAADPGEPLTAILFHVLCTHDPDAPKTRLKLELDHLGAVFDKDAFNSQRKKVQDQLDKFAKLDQLLDV